MNKTDKDLQFGMENRLKVAAKLSKNGIYLTPTHPTIDLSTYHKSSKKERNTIINRLMDRGRADGMGLDFLLSYNGHTEKIKVLIRWFSDPDVFVKNASDSNILTCYEEAIFLYVDMPLKNKEKTVRYYNILPFSFIKKQGWEWANSNRKKNSNRLVLVSNAGILIKPNAFSHHPINGGTDLFSNTPDIWTVLKSQFK